MTMKKNEDGNSTTKADHPKKAKKSSFQKLAKQTHSEQDMIESPVSVKKRKMFKRVEVDNSKEGEIYNRKLDRFHQRNAAQEQKYFDADFRDIVDYKHNLKVNKSMQGLNKYSKTLVVQFIIWWIVLIAQYLVKVSDASEMLKLWDYHYVESISETKLIDIRYQTRKLELIASDYILFDTPEQKTTQIKKTQSDLSGLTDETILLLGSNIQSESFVEDNIQKFKFRMKLRLADGTIMLLDETNFRAFVFQLMNAATILSNTDTSKIAESIYESGILTVEREYFYKINDNSFSYLEETQSKAHRLIEHYFDAKIGSSQKTAKLFGWALILGIFFVMFTQVVYSTYLFRQINSSLVLFFMIPYEEVVMIIEKAEQFVEVDLMQYQSVIAANQQRQDEENYGNTEEDDDGAEFGVSKIDTKMMDLNSQTNQEKIFLKKKSRVSNSSPETKKGQKMFKNKNKQGKNKKITEILERQESDTDSKLDEMDLRIQTMKKQKSKYGNKSVLKILIPFCLTAMAIKTVFLYFEIERWKKINVYLETQDLIEYNSKSVRSVFSITQEIIASRTYPMMDIDGNNQLEEYLEVVQTSFSELSHFKDTILEVTDSDFSSRFQRMYYENYCAPIAEDEGLDLAEHCKEELQNTGLETVGAYVTQNCQQLIQGELVNLPAGDKQTTKTLINSDVFKSLGKNFTFLVF